MRRRLVRRGEDSRRTPTSLRVTPAMQAGVADHVWTMEDIAALMDANYTPKPRGPYKKRHAN
jgi:hypothetical protein